MVAKRVESELLSAETSGRRPAKLKPSPAAEAPRILIVDDFPVARAGLRALLSERMAVAFVGEAWDAATALDLASRERPDLVLLEVAMLNGDGLPILRELRRELPEVRILAITISQGLNLVAAAIREGVHGYLIMTADQDALVSAVSRVLAGQLAIDPMLVIQAMQATGQAGAAPGEVMPEPLTAREVQVLRLVSHGHTNREIAGHLFMAVGTVKVHLEHILAKLGAADRTEAAVRAQAMGLLDDSAGRHTPSGGPNLAERRTPTGQPNPQSAPKSSFARETRSKTAGK